MRNSFDSNYLKQFLLILKNNKKKNYEIVESPFPLLVQRSNYIKGKLALYSGHYSTALEFFFKTREKHLICDANLIKRSTTQINKIYNHFCLEIDKINKSENFQIKNNPTDINVLNKLKYGIENLEKIKLKIEDEIDFLNAGLEVYTYQPKDLIVLIDFSMTMISQNSKKTIQACKIAQNIFDDYITSEDKFGLFIFTKFVNPIVSLSQKNKNTVKFINEMINELEKRVNLVVEEESNLIQAVERIYEYLKRKSLVKREKWVVVFTDKFEVQNLKNKNKIVNLKRENYNVIVVGMGIDKNSAEALNLILNFNKSEVIEFENCGRLKSILKVHGTIRDEEMNLVNERYNSERKNI